MGKNTPLLKAAINLADSYNYDKKHSRQVAKLSLQLFDGLKTSHKLKLKYRQLLEIAAILHDVGFVIKGDEHHKISQGIIMGCDDLPLSKKDKIIIGLIARYHRKSLPRRKHKFYRDLTRADRLVTSKLAALLRIGDGLDRTHQGAVKNIRCKISNNVAYFYINAGIFLCADKKYGQMKADLFKRIFKKRVIMELVVS